MGEIGQNWQNLRLALFPTCGTQEKRRSSYRDGKDMRISGTESVKGGMMNKKDRKKWFKEVPGLERVLKLYCHKKGRKFRPELFLSAKVEKVDWSLLYDKITYPYKLDKWSLYEDPFEYGSIWFIRPRMPFRRVRHIVLREDENISDRLSWFDKLFARQIVTIISYYGTLPKDDEGPDYGQQMGVMFLVKIYKVAKNTTIAYMLRESWA